MGVRTRPAPTLVTTNKLFIAAIVPVAFAAVVLITLPYALMMRLLPEHHHHGAGAGLFGMSRGIGVLVGPVLAGLAIEHTARLDVLSFGATQGYSAIFGVTSALLLASLPILRRIA